MHVSNAADSTKRPQGKCFFVPTPNSVARNKSKSTKRKQHQTLSTVLLFSLLQTLQATSSDLSVTSPRKTPLYKMRPPVQNKFPWLGTFVTTENPAELIEFFTGVGHSIENANRFTYAERIFTLSEQDDGKFCHHTEFKDFSKGISFPLGEKFTYPAFKRAPGVIVTQLYDWIPESRTLHSNVKTNDGFDFDMDFVFSEDYESAVLVQRTGEIVVNQQMERK